MSGTRRVHALMASGAVVTASLVGAAPALAGTGYCGHVVGGVVVGDYFVTGQNRHCVLRGPGDFQIAAPATASVGAVVLSQGLRFLNHGTTSANGAEAHWELQDTAVVENAASWNQDRFDRGTITGPATTLFHNDAGAVIDANRGGLDLELPTTNDGTMLSYRGEIDLLQLNNFSNGALTGGVYQADHHGFIVFPGLVTTNAATVVSTGDSYLVTGASQNAFGQLGVNTGSFTTDSAQTVGALDNYGNLTINGAAGFTSTQPITLESSGNLNIGIDATTAADKIHSSQPVQLGGALTVSTDPGFRPIPGRHYVVASSAAGVTGTFSSVQGLDLPDGDHYALTYTAHAATLQVVAPAPIPLSMRSIAPNTVGQNATDVTMTVRGAGFKDGALVGFGGSDVVATPATVLDNTTLTVSVSTSASAALGKRDVKVRNPGPGGGVAVCSRCLTVAPGPTFTVAGVAGVGARGVAVDLSGSGLSSSPQVTLTGPGVLPSFTVATYAGNNAQLTLSVPTTTAPGAYTIEWLNRDGGYFRCAGCLTIVAAPVVTGISPGTVTRGTSVPITVTGSGFAAGAVLSVAVGGVTFSAVTVVDSTTITATISTTGAAPSGPLVVSVTNGPSGGHGVGSYSGLTLQ